MASTPAYKFVTEDTPLALIELMDFIEENTGLMGEENPGTAKFYASGQQVRIVSDRKSFDYQSLILDYINHDSRLDLKEVSVMSLAGGNKHPQIDVTA